MGAGLTCKRMKLIQSVLALILVSGSAYCGYMAYLAFGLPTRPIEDYRFPPQCDRIEASSNAYKGSPLECEARLREADLLKVNPGLAVRQGDNLTLFYANRIVTRLVASETPDECDTVSIHKVLAVRDESSAHMTPLVQISCHHGEFEQRFIVLRDGNRWWIPDASASPDGRILAVGQNYAYNDPSFAFTLYGWPSRKELAQFDAYCRGLVWTDADNLEVTCVTDERSAAFDAVVRRDSAGKWRMQATRWLRPFMRGYNDMGDMEYPPAFSLKWLPEFEAR